MESWRLLNPSQCYAREPFHVSLLTLQNSLYHMLKPAEHTFASRKDITVIVYFVLARLVSDKCVSIPHFLSGHYRTKMILIWL
jgi:hypothetical protein